MTLIDAEERSRRSKILTTNHTNHTNRKVVRELARGTFAETPGRARGEAWCHRSGLRMPSQRDRMEQTCPQRTPNDADKNGLESEGDS